MDNIDPRLIDALKLENDFWEKGDEDILVLTHSGSMYTVKRNGAICGGYLGRERSAKLSGAVYRKGGPIRVNKIVLGLSIEARTDDNRILVTSPVEAIYYLGEKEKHDS